MEIFNIRDLYAYGVRWELQDNSVNHIVEPKVEAVASAEKPVAVPSAAPVNPNTEATAARGIAKVAATPSDLCTAISSFENHPLKKFAKNVVPPKFASAPHASGKKLAVVIDVLSIEDDATGAALSGANGEMFDKMMTAAGFTRENISIIPLLFWRAPGGRSPTESELDIARPFFDRALELAEPDAIIAFGSASAAAFGAKISKESGVFADFQGVTVVPMFGFDYMVMKPESKRITWESLQKLLKSWE